MSVNIFIQEHSGNYHGESELESSDQIPIFVEEMHKRGGYWVDDSKVFVPWHRIDFIEVIEVADDTN